MNNIDSFSSLPEDCKMTIFSDIPRESATVLPFVSKDFFALASKNDLWDKIATRCRVKNLKLDFTYNKDESKRSFLMRNKEIVDMFIGGKYIASGPEIDIYNPIDQLVLEKLNQEINMGQSFFCTIFNDNVSQLKQINFMLDICQKPRIEGYLTPFLCYEDLDAIYLVMDRCKEILEKEYKSNKNFLQQIEYNRKQKKIPAPLTMNPLEKAAHEITTLYEIALKVFNSRDNI